jgi:hypothetical protein
MENNINFKELWSQKTIRQPNSKDLLSSFNKIKKEEKRKLMTVNTIISITIIYIVCLTIYFKPNLITTKIGIALTIIGLIVYLIVYNKLILKLIKVSETKNNNDFLLSLIKINNRKTFLQTRMLQFYFVTLTLGISLYLYEYLSLLPFAWSILGYSITLIWVGFNWFYLRPKVIKKERSNYKEIISKFEKIVSQN